jgi:hypothetical protein
MVVAVSYVCMQAEAAQTHEIVAVKKLQRLHYNPFIFAEHILPLHWLLSMCNQAEDVQTHEIMAVKKLQRLHYSPCFFATSMLPNCRTSLTAGGLSAHP